MASIGCGGDCALCASRETPETTSAFSGAGRGAVSRGIRASERPSTTMQRPLVRSPCSSGIFACQPNNHGSEQTEHHHGEDREAYCRQNRHSAIGGSSPSGSVEWSIDVAESVRLCVQVWAILGRLHDERSHGGLPHASRSASTPYGTPR